MRENSAMPASTAPSPFTAEDYAARMTRAATDAATAGLAGVLVAPGPDLVWLTGYRPTAITERLTLLVLLRGGARRWSCHGWNARTRRRPPAPVVEMVDSADGTDPYRAASALLRPEGRYGISDNAWAMHLLGLQQALPGSIPVAHVLPAHAARGEGRA